MAHAVWRTSLRDDIQHFEKAFVNWFDALSYAEDLARSHVNETGPHAQNISVKVNVAPGVTPESTIGVVTCVNSDGFIFCTFIVKTLTIEGEDEDEPQMAPTQSSAELTVLEQVNQMYASYMEIRKRLVTAMKRKDIRDLVDVAPGPKPSGKPKAASILRNSPTELTPARLRSVLEYLDGKVDI